MSLLEMIVTLALLALLMAAAVPATSSHHAEVRSSSMQIAAELRALRADAIARDHNTELSLDATNRTILSSLDKHPRKLPHSIQTSFVATSLLSKSESTGTILFFSDGSSSGGRITLSNGQDTFVLNVEWLSGAVTVDRQP